MTYSKEDLKELWDEFAIKTIEEEQIEALEKAVKKGLEKGLEKGK